MHPSQRPPNTTSWVQMSATGATSLATSQATRRTNFAPQQQHQDASGAGHFQQDPQQPQLDLFQAQPTQGHHPRLSFISSSSSSSVASSPAASISSSSAQQQQQPLGATQAGSRLASVLSGAGAGGIHSTPTGSGPQPTFINMVSQHSLSSTASSSSGSGGSSFQTANQAGAGLAVATTSNTNQSDNSLFSMSIGAPSQQLQAAMGELHLAEQQLLGVSGDFGALAGQSADDAAADQEAQQRDANRKLRLQLYVFVLRCISYPFNAKQQAAGDHRQQQAKLRKAQLEQIIGAHQRFVRSSGAFASGKCPHAHLSKVLTASQLKQLDELYERAHMTFQRRILQNERMRLLVEAECCSQQDLRDLFHQNAERVLKESQLFLLAQQQQRQQQQHQQHQHQQQQQRAFMTAASTSSSSSQRSGQSYKSLPSDEMAADSGGGQQQQAEQVLQQPGSHTHLLNNREAILNAWLLKFESIVSEEPAATSAGGGDSTLMAASGNSSLSLLRNLPASSGGSNSASNLLLSEQQQQQHQQQANQQQANQQQQPQQMTKEQLYQMFQNILNIKKFEHQLLYNALQLDSSDEQAAAIRRELDGRVARIAELERNKKLLPKFVLKEMESLFLEETRMAVNKLMVNLDSLPVIKSTGHHGHGHQFGESRGVYSGLQKFRRYNSRTQASLTRDGLAESHPSEPQLSKLDVVLSFNIEVIVMEVRGLRNISATREIYCTMEIEGSETGRLQTEHVQAKKPLWDTQGDFVTNHPLPYLKIKLYAVNPSMLSLEDKELGKLVLRPTVLSPKTPEWCTMLAISSDKSSLGGKDSSGGGGGGGGVGGSSGRDSSGQAGGSSSASGDNSSPLGGGEQQAGDQLKIRVIVRMDRPQQLKHCGSLWGVGKSAWRKFRRRYHILIQVSQYTFVMCDFREKKSKPSEMLQLDGYTVDYIEPPTDLIMEHCSEVTSAEHHHAHHSSGGSGSSAFGLAGRLAKPFLKQQPLSNLVSGSNQSDDLGGPGASSGLGSAGAGGYGGYGDSGQEQPSAIQTAAALSDELHNKFYFNVVKEGDSVVFACDDEQECFGWVMALYRATGQAHKPTPLRDQYSSSSSHYIDAAFAYNASASGREQTKLVGGSTSASGLLNGAGQSSSVLHHHHHHQGSKSSVDVADQRARKHGMDEFISADPCKFQHNQLFKQLQNETLSYRLNDQFLSLGWFSPGQLFVLDEYCARYGVRTCYRHLSYLNSLLDFNVRGYFIDHTLLNYGYDFCSSFVSGQSGALNPMSSVNFDLRPDGTVGTVTVEERDLFHCVKQKLLKMIERQLANFSYCFPYGKPDGALKSTLSLLERVLMKQESAANQMNSMLQNDEVRSLIRKCLEQAALNNYTKLSGQANLLQAPVASSCGQSQQSNNGQNSAANGGGANLSIDSSNSGQSSPSCSPVVGAADDCGDYGSFLSRKRTQSNLSAVSSSNSAPTSTSSSYGPSALVGGSQTMSHSNGSVRRNQRFQQQSNVNQQQQQQQQQEPCLTMAMIINNDQVRPQEKLRYLIRLAEFCCEQVEENNEYFADAFAWHSDLMMDHFELFWSLFSVDMDKILAELNSSAQLQQQQQQQQQIQQQSMPLGRTISSSSGVIVGAPAGTSSSSSSNIKEQHQSDLLGVSNRETFALFQVLNNHMRRNTNFECRKFKAYLCDTFKPKLLLYIDIMESTLTRLVFKACEKDGQVNCQMIEQMFLKLDELQRFVLRQLRWPNEQLAEQLHQRLKLIAYELCDASVQRTLQAFQQLERRSNKWTATTTSYNSPVEMIQMINLTLDTRNRSLKLCTFNGFDQMSYHSKIDKLVEGALGEMQPGLMAKMLNALDSTLNKLARFDEGNLLAPILSLTYKQGMSSSGRDIGKQYASFVSSCCDLVRQKINDEIWIVTLLEDWYAAQMNSICTWLAERIDRSLHDVQLVALTNIMPKIYHDMSLQGVSEDKLNLKTYQTIMSRLKMEEAASLASGGLFEQPSSSIFNTSILSSLTSSGQQQQQPSSGSLSNPQQQQQQQHHQQHQPTGNQLRQQPSVGSFGGGAASNQSGVGSSTVPGTPSRRLLSSISSSSGGGGGGGGGQSPEQLADEGDNIADRALQSATRMFKGFWN